MDKFKLSRHMFTGIIETLGQVTAIDKQGDNLEFTIQSTLATELKIDQSVSHNGVCLTVTSVTADAYTIIAVKETLQKTNLALLKVGHQVNLERAMVLNQRIDGHIVQGHVDGTGSCLAVTAQNGSWLYRIGYPDAFAGLMVEKGSICLNGISLTVFDVTESEFSVAIIPYTYEHTNMQHPEVSDIVNLEFDILGKYVARQLEVRK
ncbi:riboflavin synthase [Chitinophaga sedimenti]|uniref:riboflavin synthase n=1 Tax=Chitinophaga sedimenti TaxID=2033606 RepID=UPI002002C3EF|nr:riboflavin synthase [Chitinophaga sedimenti]MCK7559967.1 riboflavin synthase [Chitinophaga sedimenti]